MKRLMAHRILALVFGALALATVATMMSWSGPPGRGFWFWFIACFAGELLWIRLPLGQATDSMASCFHFATLLLLPRGHAMAIAALSGGLAETAVLRKPPLRVIYNASQASLAVGLASLAYHGLAGGQHDLPAMLYSSRLLPFIAAAAAYYLVNTGSVSLAVALAENVRPWSAWKRNFGTRYDALTAGAVISLGALLASHYALTGATGTLLVVLPLVIAYEGLRLYTQRRGRPSSTPEEERDAA
jgi:MASE9